jgi:hypothetical protein
MEDEDEDNSCRTIRRAQGQLERRNESKALTDNADGTLACTHIADLERVCPRTNPRMGGVRSPASAVAIPRCRSSGDAYADEPEIAHGQRRIGVSEDCATASRA